MHSSNVFANIDDGAPAYTCIPCDKRRSPFITRLLRTAGLDVKRTYKYKLYRTEPFEFHFKSTVVCENAWKFFSSNLHFRWSTDPLNTQTTLRLFGKIISRTSFAKWKKLKLNLSHLPQDAAFAMRSSNENVSFGAVFLASRGRNSIAMHTRVPSQNPTLLLTRTTPRDPVSVASRATTHTPTRRRAFVPRAVRLTRTWARAVVAV